MTLNIRNIWDLIIPQYSITIITMFSVFLLVERDISKILVIALPVCSYLFALFGFNVLNDVFDVNMDKISKPLRPLPSKRVSEKEAKTLSLFLFFCSIILAAFSPKLLLVILCFILATLMYSHPKVLWRKHFWGTPVFGMIFYGIVPFLSITTYLGKETPLLFLFFFSALIAAVSATKDIEDIEAEKKFGINSIPKKIGVNKTLWLTVVGLHLLIVFVGLVLIQRNLLFFFPAIASLFFTILVSTKILKKRTESTIITQSKVVSLLMILVVLIQLLFGITVFLTKS